MQKHDLAHRWIPVLGFAALIGAAFTDTAHGDSVVPRLDDRFAPAKAAQQDEVPNFKRHVVPLLGQLGCNGRACHGSFQGRGGFQLSLFGYDFKADHEALMAGDDEPRVNLKDIEQSLIIAKPTDEDFHEGGQRYTKDSWQYQVIRRWIASGAKNDAAESGELERLVVTPAEIRFAKDNQQVQLKAIAHWRDGTREDVTPLCRFQTNDAAIAEVSEEGLIVSQGSGDTHVIVFYDNGITPVPILRPIAPDVVADYPQVPTPTKIDELVVAKLKKLGIVPSELTSDEQFLRRVSLDITGTLPTPQEVLAFIQDKSPSKRAAKVDELLDRPGYAAWWTTKLCDLTGNNARNLGNNQFRNEESRQWYDWIYKRVAENTPYDELAAGIVLATGRESDQDFEAYCREMCEYISEDKDFAENESMPHFWSRRTLRQPEEKALSFAHAFLGVRLQCAQCHKHPFDQWSKQDFEQFTAFFSGIQYGTPRQDNETYREMLESLGLKGKRNGDLRKMIPKLLEEGKVVPFREVYVAFDGRGRGRRRNANDEPPAKQAKLLGGKTITFTEGDDPRTAIMQWMRNDGSRYFAKALVNRVWAGYFHVGIVEPPDDMNLANPPSNAPLLDWLTEQFIAHDYDMKWLHRTIALSRTYQLSWRTNETNRFDDRNFSHAVPRRLQAETVHDALRQATGKDGETAEQILAVNDRAVGPNSALQGGNRGASYVLATFGKPARETNCDCERSVEPSLLQVLYLRNDREMLSLIEQRGGWLDQLARENKLQFNAGSSPNPGSDLAAKIKAGNKRVGRIKQELKQLAGKIKAAQKSGDEELVKRLERQQATVQQRQQQLEQRIAGATQSRGNAGSTAAAGSARPEKVAATPEVAAQFDAWIRDAYLRSLSRLPSQEETQTARKHIAESDTPIAGLRDVLWALLNTKEFITNH